MKKICFAVLVHDNREVIKDQLENIRYFCPSASIVLFNGGNDPTLCTGLGYPVCPTSHPIIYGRTHSFFILNVMEWLEKIGYQYDYLINLDSDCLFAKKGFEEFISSEMNGCGYMAAYFRRITDDWYPATTMRRVWHLWQPIFNMNHFYGSFGAQVFSRMFVRQILSFNRLGDLKWVMQQTVWQIFALEEMLFATLAVALGVKSKPYPDKVGKWMRYLPKFTLEEIRSAINNQAECYLLHPIHRIMNDPARSFVRNMIGK